MTTLIRPGIHGVRPERIPGQGDSKERSSQFPQVDQNGFSSFPPMVSNDTPQTRHACQRARMLEFYQNLANIDGCTVVPWRDRSRSEARAQEKPTNKANVSLRKVCRLCGRTSRPVPAPGKRLKGSQC